MSYIRPLGDGPITDPSQVDDPIPVVPPTRVDCAALPPDSPWRQPGQVCAPTIVDAIKGLIEGVTGPGTTSSSNGSTATSAPATGVEGISPLWYAAAGAAAYYLYRQYKRGR
jgi:hypothetical protein